MPLYEYQCDACGFRFELIQRFSDPLVTECTSCGGHVRKLLSSAAIQFKGSGWYVTDYAGKGRDPESRASSDANPATDAKSSTPATTASTSKDPAS